MLHPSTSHGSYRQVILPGQQRTIVCVLHIHMHKQAFAHHQHLRPQKTPGNDPNTQGAMMPDPKVGKAPHLCLRKERASPDRSDSRVPKPQDRRGKKVSCPVTDAMLAVIGLGCSPKLQTSNPETTNWWVWVYG